MAHHTAPIIDILLPHKERFTAQNAGAVSTVVYELARHEGAKRQDITIFGSVIEDPKDGVCYQGLEAKAWPWQSRNEALCKAYLRYLSTHHRTPDLIEVHGRPHLALMIAKKRPDLRVILYLHNDPRDMKGANSPALRKELATHLCAIISITHYIKACFCDGLDDEATYNAAHFVNHLGVERTIEAPLAKQKYIFLAGRMVPEKGFLEAAKGALAVLRDHPEWSIYFAGGTHFAKSAPSAYETQLRTVLAELGPRAVFLGHMPIAEIRHYQQQAEICVVPSLWQEPGGLTVLEALAAGSALITTDRGGIPEFAQNRALIIEPTAPNAFEEAFRTLIEQPSKRQALQQAAYDDYPFSASAMSARAARFRLSLLR